jgi:thioredoxin-dependent peroxiredoxin
MRLLIIITSLLFMKSLSAQIKEGDKLPDFSLPDKEGKMFHIADIVGKKNLVIYFYPKDETKGCTAEACSFRDSYEVFLEKDAEVIGISGDSPASHKKFAENHHLPFILLSDEKNKIRKLFGVPSNMMGVIPGRVTYVVDKSGIIKLIFNSQTEFTKHITESLKVLSEAGK